MDLKGKTIVGMIWSGVERFGYAFIAFLSNLFLARLLSPEDFGLIGMITVFVSVATIIVDGGFTAALIQKREIRSEDYSTAFYVNLIFSLILYAILNFSAPVIARFYAEDSLSSLLRVLGIVLVTNAFSVVQIAKIKRDLNFRYLSVVTIVSSLVGCVVGVVCAFCSMGVWSLVVQTLTISGVRCGILIISSSWRPSFEFSWKAVKEQFSFGSMVLFSNLTDTIYMNSISLIVGKTFSSQTLGLYTQARALESVPNNTLTAIVNQVTFPVFSRLQNDAGKLLAGVRKVARCLAWMNFPLMVLLILVAEPLFVILYTDRWIEAVPLFQIACCGGIVMPLVQLNMCVLIAQGYSKLCFFSRLLRQSIGFAFITMMVFTGNLLWLMVVGVAFVPYMFLVVTIIYTKKVMPAYGFRKQFVDVMDVLLYSFLCGVVSYAVSYWLHLSEVWGQLCVRLSLFCGLYLLISKYFMKDVFQVYWFEMKKIGKKIILKNYSKR